jgi:hypothetical protein
VRYLNKFFAYCGSPEVVPYLAVVALLGIAVAVITR